MLARLAYIPLTASPRSTCVAGEARSGLSGVPLWRSCLGPSSSPMSGFSKRRPCSRPCPSGSCRRRCSSLACLRRSSATSSRLPRQLIDAVSEKPPAAKINGNGASITHEKLEGSMGSFVAHVLNLNPVVAQRLPLGKYCKTSVDMGNIRLKYQQVGVSRNKNLTKQLFSLGEYRGKVMFQSVTIDSRTKHQGDCET